PPSAARRPPRSRSSHAAVTVLVLLAAAAGARVVAAHLLLGADGSRGAAGARLAAGRAARTRSRAGRRGAERLRLVGGELHGRLPLVTALQVRIGLDLDAEHVLGHVQADVGLHLLEEVEALEGVLLQRVALPVATQADALPEHVHVVEVLLPVLVDDLQDDEALEL